MMTATVNALYSPPDNPWSATSPCKDHSKACLSLSFPSQKDYGLWNSSPKQPSQISWATAATVEPLDLSFLQTPQEIDIPETWDDDVSVLQDNPEDDNIEVLYLPRSTYDVLVPLFDELYIGNEEGDAAAPPSPNEEERQEQEASACS